MKKIIVLLVVALGGLVGYTFGFRGPSHCKMPDVGELCVVRLLGGEAKEEAVLELNGTRYVAAPRSETELFIQPGKYPAVLRRTGKNAENLELTLDKLSGAGFYVVDPVAEQGWVLADVAEGYKNPQATITPAVTVAPSRVVFLPKQSKCVLNALTAQLECPDKAQWIVRVKPEQLADAKKLEADVTKLFRDELAKVAVAAPVKK